MSSNSSHAEADRLVAADLAARAHRTCSPFSTVTEAVLIFKDEDSDMVPVIDEGKLVGMVTDRDVALAVADHPDIAAVPVAEIMARNPASLSRDAPVDEVIRTMVTEGAHTVFVVDANGMLDGVISWSDLAKRVPIGTMTGAFDTCDSAEVETP
jgi:predicted transcriptional regulator